MTYRLMASVLAIGVAAGGPAVAQVVHQPRSQPSAQMPHSMPSPGMAQMGPMHDPRMHAQMTNMMPGCHRMMSQMPQMPPASPSRR